MPVTVVLHTTEGVQDFDRQLAFFRNNPGKKPHDLICPTTKRHGLLLDYDQPAKALQNDPGGVETNRRGGVIQVEIVARAAEVALKPDDWYQYLADRLAIICQVTGCPPRLALPFVPYPASYGERAPQRLSFGAWLTVEGIIGHQHVPENDHGDPGDVNRLTDYLPKDQTMTPPSLTDLGAAMAAVDELYRYYRGTPPTEPERKDWARDIRAKLLRGEDPTATIRYIDWALAGKP